MSEVGPDGLISRESAAKAAGYLSFTDDGYKSYRVVIEAERDAIVETIREMDTQAHTRHPNYKWPVLAGRSDRLPVITGWQCDVSCPACAVEAFRRKLLAELGVKE